MRKEKIIELKKRLKAKYKEKDVDKALGLAKRISALDRHVFPEKPIEEFNFSPKARGSSMAGHVPYRKSCPEHYTIWISDIAKRIKDEIMNKQPVFCSRSGKLRLVYISWEELLWGIAAHEVRHRVQLLKKIKRFSPRHVDIIDNPILRAMIGFQSCSFEILTKKYRKEGKSEQYIRRKTRSAEFDAYVVELFVIQSIRRKDILLVFDDMVDIVKNFEP